MALLVGALIASGVGLFATVLGLDRDGAFYTVVMMFIASYYALFAVTVHGIFDLTHDTFIANAGVPVWWPEFCPTYDVTAAAYLAWLLTSGRIRSAA